jgi:hypothetical protein
VVVRGVDVEGDEGGGGGEDPEGGFKADAVVGERDAAALGGGAIAGDGDGAQARERGNMENTLGECVVGQTPSGEGAAGE